jgi:hypothetical protein
MLENSNLLTFFLLLIIGFIVLFFSGRKYLEHFQSPDSRPRDRFNRDGTPVTKVRTTLKQPDMPYLMDPIDNLDAYEVSAVYQLQGTKEASKRQLNDAMTRYPIDWSNQGPNSQYFQEKQGEYERESAEKSKLPISDVPYQNIDDSDRAIPDMEAIQEEEKKILQTYQPMNSKGLLQYSVQDVKHLLHKVYGKKGLIPVINKSKQGENIWEITEVKEKNPKIVWDDGATTGGNERNAMTQRGEETIIVPPVASDSSLDPFFQPRDKVRTGKQDYTQWTPGMERMFAPTYPVKSWF